MVAGEGALRARANSCHPVCDHLGSCPACAHQVLCTPSTNKQVIAVLVDIVKDAGSTTFLWHLVWKKTPHC